MGKKRKTSTDKKQDNRLKTLEKFVYQTIENKQLNYTNTNNALTTAWQETGQFMASSPIVTGKQISQKF